jgi:hypothetical protein
MHINTTAAERLLRVINNLDNTGFGATPAITGPHNGSSPFQDVTA